MCVDMRLKIGSIWFWRTGIFAASGICRGRGLSGVNVFPRLNDGASGGELEVIDEKGMLGA
jgi:hypothetical protein